MNLETWLIFALTEAFMCMIPGPAVLLVVSSGNLQGRVRAHPWSFRLIRHRAPPIRQSREYGLIWIVYTPVNYR